MDLLNNDQPGFWVFEFLEARVYLHYNCPCGCKRPGCVRVLPPSAEPPASTLSHCWLWDGNKTAPTLSPSLRRHTACKFHGYLEAGAWRACDDGPPVAANAYHA
jgi:Family of unknown function (DUF6527)